MNPSNISPLQQDHYTAKGSTFNPITNFPCIGSFSLAAGDEESAEETNSKERHTGYGPRNRRIRIGVKVAHWLFGLHDMLGYGTVTETLEWLLTKSLSDIKLLPNFNSYQRVFEVSLPIPTIVSSKKNKKRKTKKTNGNDNGNGNKRSERDWGIISGVIRKGLRAKARERARERTKEKLRLRGVISGNVELVNYYTPVEKEKRGDKGKLGFSGAKEVEEKEEMDMYGDSSLWNEGNNWAVEPLFNSFISHYHYNPPIFHQQQI